MADTCGEGLAHFAAVPEALARLLAAVAANLEAHCAAIDRGEAISQPELHAYAELVEEHRDLEGRLRLLAEKLAGCSALPMAVHDEAQLASTRAREALADLVAQERAVALLQRQLADQHQAMLDSAGSVRTERSEPAMPARDLDETRAFYRGLGFTPWFGPESRWQSYEIVSRGELVLHFFADRNLPVNDGRYGGYLRVKDADALHREFAAAGLPHEGNPRMSDIEDQEWGMREFVLVDPSGNLLRIGHDL